MRQASLKLKTNIQNVNILNNIQIEKHIFKIMISILVALAIWYVLILGSTVFNIVERKSLEKEALSLGNNVSNLELSYLSISNNVDLALSSKMGFKETKASFATRKSLGSLKIDKNEI